MIDTSAFQGKTAAYFTLGCKLNFSETSTFGKILQEMGVRTAQKGEQADICLINTCSVTEVADHKCRQAIHRMVRNHPHAFVVVTGCYAQLEAEEVAKIEGVDLVLGSDEKARLIQFLTKKLDQPSLLIRAQHQIHTLDLRHLLSLQLGIAARHHHKRMGVIPHHPVDRLATFMVSHFSH